ncbi:biotin transporter BioY [Sulfitobacter aestuariivivens]|uniref:Biotin transporter n=1 Tax=Sulfitobacter aestuariivivens TaxID=2766981 RepID=A0A927HFS6_9RHOB|nr:biotin transporter BioY [Sulfitobacter aestuariivivens]MBD3664734.1 biotin transporter BioY [Sulfitobacter aestuariivivens]
MERSVTLIALFTALIAALGLIPQLTLAYGVPITAQSLGIMLCGTVLGSKRGGLAALLFVGLVAMGLPLLAGGRGGLGIFATGSAGYLVGYVLGAFVTGLVMERMQGLSIGLTAGVAATLGGIVVVHLCGIVGLMVVLNLGLIEAIVVDSVFVPGDFIKMVFAAFVTAGIARARPASLLSRA